MTEQKRAEVAFRIAGIALAARHLPHTVGQARFLLQTVRSGGMPIANILLPLAVMLLYGLAPLVLVLFGGRLSRLLLAPAERTYDNLAQQVLHIGVCLAALGWSMPALVGAPAVLLLRRTWESLALSAVFALPLVVVIFSWPVARFLHGRGDGAVRSGKSTGYLAAGLLLIGGSALFVGSLQALARLVADGNLSLAVRLGRPLARLTCGVALILLTGRLSHAAAGRWTARAALPQHPGDGSVRWYEIALFLAVTYGLIHALNYLSAPPHVLGAAVWAIVFLLLLAAPVVAGARLLVPRLAGLLAGRCFADDRGEPRSVITWVEAGITLLALHMAAGALVHAARSAIRSGAVALTPSGAIAAEVTFPSSTSPYVALGTAFGALTVLLFRGDLAWLFRGRLPQKPTGSPSARAALLYPGIFLLGVWHLTQYLPGVISLLLGPMDHHAARPWTIPARLTGLLLAAVLFTLSAPLARLLTHDPLLPRIWWLGHERPDASDGPHNDGSQS